MGAIDADAHKSLAQKFSVTGFPTIKIFTGSKHIPFSGQRTAESFVDAALRAAKDKAYENLGKKSSSSDKVNRLRSLRNLISKYLVKKTNITKNNSPNIAVNIKDNKTSLVTPLL